MRITIKSRRNFIRIVSFALAFVVALAGFSLYQYRSAVLLSRSTGYTYRQSFGDLSDALSGMDSCLTKMSYTTSPVQIIALSERMCTYAACANTAISTLPVSELHLEKITSFISQANGYTSSLARNAAAGIEPGSEEMRMLGELSDYASLISGTVSQMNGALQDGDLSAYRIEDLFREDTGQSAFIIQAMASVPEMSTVFTDLEQEFADYPTLIYDGPYSEHLLNSQSVFLEGMAQVSADDARAYVAALFGKQVDDVSLMGESQGRIPVYFVGFADTFCEISKAGGYPVTLRVNREVGEDQIGESASAYAAAFLQKLGLDNMVESYHLSEDNIMTINFAYQDGDSLCYPDLVKVGVALDNGEIVSFEASGFLYHHKLRGAALVPRLDLASCAAAVDDQLSVTSSRLCVIPTAGKNEALCYEYVCQSPSFDTFLVYINANTGKQEDMLILEQNDHGELTI